MMDSEQVIKALEKHLNNLDCDECPYWNTCHDYNNDDVVMGLTMYRDALALLKEREEPCEPRWHDRSLWQDGKEYKTERPFCGNCKERIPMLRFSDKYCPACGKRVKWGEKRGWVLKT